MTILLAYEFRIGSLTVSTVGGLGMAFCYFIILGAVIAIPALSISTYFLNYRKTRRALIRIDGLNIADFENGSNLLRYMCNQSMGTFYLMASIVVLFVFGTHWDDSLARLLKALHRG